MLLFIGHFSLLKIFDPKAMTIDQEGWFIEGELKTQSGKLQMNCLDFDVETQSRDLDDHASFHSKMADRDADFPCLKTIAQQILWNWEEEMIEDGFSTDSGHANHSLQ